MSLKSSSEHIGSTSMSICAGHTAAKPVSTHRQPQRKAAVGARDISPQGPPPAAERFEMMMMICAKKMWRERESGLANCSTVQLFRINALHFLPSPLGTC